MTTDFSRMFNPKGIAIVGASEDAAKPGAQTLAALSRYGYQGAIGLVNPRSREVGGRVCHASIAELPGDYDVAVVALAAEQVAGAIRDCGRKGIAFAVVLGGGFRENGAAGIEREAALIKAARESKVRLIGPNCLGYVNVPNRVYASFSSLARSPDLVAGPVSAVIQSGGFGNSLVVNATLAGIGFQNVVASGNEADISAAELIDAFVDDPDTRIILAYLEGLADGRDFIAAAERAAGAGKPLIVLKAGNTEQGAVAAASHTAYLTSSYDIYQAAFRRCGIIESRDIDDTVDMLKAFSASRLPAGRSVGVMGGSGGSAVNFSDAADAFGLKLAQLSDDTVQTLCDSLPSTGTIKNPIDYTASFITGPEDLRFLHVLQALLADPSVDQAAILLALTAGARFEIVAGFIVKAMAENAKPVHVFSSVPLESAPGAFARLRQNGVPVYSSPRRMAVAMAALADHAANQQETARGPSAGTAGEMPELPCPPEAGGILDEAASKRVLASFDIEVTRDFVIDSAQALTAPVPGLAFPLAAKVLSADIAHKSEAGGVRLGLGDLAALNEACAGIMHNVAERYPRARVSGILLSEMVPAGVELIVGALNDRVFGPLVTVGLGGVMTEILHDTAYRIAPFSEDEAGNMLAELRGYRLLTGYRGDPARDIAAVRKVLSKVSQLAWQMRDRLVELDINPLIVREAGKGAVAADALLVLK